MTFRNALLIVLIIEVGVALLAVINFGTSLEALQAVTRFSGRFKTLECRLVCD